VVAGAARAVLRQRRTPVSVVELEAQVQRLQSPEHLLLVLVAAVVVQKMVRRQVGPAGLGAGVEAAIEAKQGRTEPLILEVVAVVVVTEFTPMVELAGLGL